MKIAFSVCIAGLMLAACSNEKPPEPKGLDLPATVKPEIGAVVQGAWPKALKACPGLVKYADELKFSGVEDNLSYAPEHARRIDVKFKVPESPKRIPADLQASGHTCYFSLSPDGTKLTVSKSACAKVCKDDPSAESETTFSL